jgi:tRNA dimethylallyltransferase
MKPKVIAIVGQTAVGKTKLSIEIAKQLDGEIVSVDSRQVYKYLDVGSAKISKEEMEGIPHHLLDVVEPHEHYSVERFKKDAEKAIDEITKRGKVPILVGGSPHYMDALMYGEGGAAVPPDISFRKKKEKESDDDLHKELTKASPERAKQIPKQNKRRVIRALEIIKSLGSIPKQERQEKYEVFFIGLKREKDDLRKRIQKRIDERAGEIKKEAEKLHEKHNVDWGRLEEFGLEYRYGAKLVQGELSEEEFKKELFHKTWQFAKRQNTWWKRNEKIQWYHPDEIDEILRNATLFIAEE